MKPSRDKDRAFDLMLACPDVYGAKAKGVDRALAAGLPPAQAALLCGLSNEEYAATLGFTKRLKRGVQRVGRGARRGLRTAARANPAALAARGVRAAGKGIGAALAMARRRIFRAFFGKLVNRRARLLAYQQRRSLQPNRGRARGGRPLGPSLHQAQGPLRAAGRRRAGRGGGCGARDQRPADGLDPGPAEPRSPGTEAGGRRRGALRSPHVRGPRIASGSPRECVLRHSRRRGGVTAAEPGGRQRTDLAAALRWSPHRCGPPRALTRPGRVGSRPYQARSEANARRYHPHDLRVVQRKRTDPARRHLPGV